jgi:single-stranded DNA-binding protein
MSIEALILAKLHNRPEQRTGKTGRPFVACKARASTDADAVFINVVAFSESTCAALLALDAGDAVALAGTLKPGAWIDRDGNARPSLDLVAAQVLTVYGLAKKRKASAKAGDAQQLITTGSDGAADSGPDDAWLRGEA